MSDLIKPDFITFTGADDMTSHAELLSLSHEYPVEFGILFSKKREGQPRYPSRKWINRLKEFNIFLAAHLCGYWARQVNQTGSSDVDKRMGMFDRIQVNIAEPLQLDIIERWKNNLRAIHGHDFRIILQTRSEFPEDVRFEWLFDASGGRGISPVNWPVPPIDSHIRIGYAGGLGPNTVEAAVQNIKAMDYWIDMETGIRNDRDHFDIHLCRDVCQKTSEHKNKIL